MKTSELLRLVWMNINQNKFKSVLTSVGIVVGAATIVLVIGIGQGGQAEIAEQFAELNAGAIDITYEYAGEESQSGEAGGFMNGIGQFFGCLFGGGGFTPGRDMGGGAAPGEDLEGSRGDSASEGTFPGGGFTPGGEIEGSRGGSISEGDLSEEGGFRPEEGLEGSRGGSASEGTFPENQEAAFGESTGENGNSSGTAEGRAAGAGTQEGEDVPEDTESETSMVEDRLNQSDFVLTQEDVEDVERNVSGITGATISYSTKASVEGGNLESAQTYTIAGVKENFMDLGKLGLLEGAFLTEEEEETKEKVCVLGMTVAKELFEDAASAVGSRIYIEDRSYVVEGVLQSSQTVASGISPDTAVLIPYETGIKYITGTDFEPVVTVIARDVSVLDEVIEDVEIVLEENHANARFTFEDSGSKMQAAQSSNKTLTLLLSVMALIVFFVGGIGIMNALFVSVKERTNEIGILKALGTSRGSILTEFLIESAAISMIGGSLGVMLSFLVIPAAEWLEVRVEVGLAACTAALGFSVLTGTVFGIYPAWKASRLEPVEALNAE